MKRRLIVLLVLIISSTTLTAQRQIRIGYIDMDYILKNVPDYQEANQQLDKKIQKWAGEIALKQEKIKDLKEDLENERPLLTKDLIQERQDEIDYQQKKLQQYQQKRFGPEGDMIAQRREIVQPIQDEVFNAVQEIGKKREYDFIFDNSSEALMLFSANRHDISDQVLANITRNSKKIARTKDKEERKEKAEKGEPIYKSVKQAKKDKEEKEQRETEKKEKEAERKAEMEKRQNQRDSVRTARKQEYEERQEKIKQERQAKRDSLQKVRDKMMQERQQHRDSVMQDRQKAKKNR